MDFKRQNVFNWTIYLDQTLHDFFILENIIKLIKYVFTILDHYNGCNALQVLYRIAI